MAAASALATRVSPASAATIPVTTTADAGAGSLREAIATSNASTGVLDTIEFAITPFDGTVKTIALASALPAVTDPVVIDGYTQPGASGNTLAVGDDAVLLVELDGSGAGASADGLSITAGGTTVTGLVINRFRGSGLGNGISIFSSGGNRIVGNFIGTDPTGTIARGNEDSGIAVQGGADGNTIGGTTPDARNIISANARVAFFVTTAGNVIQGNYIGVQRDGVSPLGNQSGVGLVGIGGSNGNLVGGTAAGAGNVIAFNEFLGIVVAAPSGSGNSFLGNSIFSNGTLGIDLIGDGVTENDQADADGGANTLQNFPILAAPMFPGGTSVAGTLNSTPGRTFRIEVFANDECDASLHGEGKTFLGTVDTATTNGSGDVTFSVDFGQTLGASLLTATATDLTTGDTSEFSTCPVPPTTTTSSTSTSSTSTSTSTTLPPVCLDGATISKVQLVLKKLGSPAGDEQLIFKGRVDFPAGMPAVVDPAAKGAQVLVEDTGAGGAPRFALTHLTTPVAPGAAGTACGTRDGWKKLRYKNTSTAIDPPACTAGSANGLRGIRFTDKRAKGKGLAFVVKVKGGAIAAPVGPPRGTIVLGATVTESLAGECGVHTFSAGSCRTKGTTLKCRE